MINKSYKQIMLKALSVEGFPLRCDMFTDSTMIGGDFHKILKRLIKKSQENNAELFIKMNDFIYDIDAFLRVPDGRIYYNCTFKDYIYNSYYFPPMNIRAEKSYIQTKIMKLEPIKYTLIEFELIESSGIPSFSLIKKYNLAKKWGMIEKYNKLEKYYFKCLSEFYRIEGILNK